MKKIYLLLLLIAFQLGYSQEKKEFDFKKNELRINAFMLILGAPEISYERIINEESSFGANVGFAIDNDFDNKFTFSPFYRMYFGKKPAAGFFAEGFGMLNTIETDIYNYVPMPEPNFGYTSIITQEKYVDFALGIGLGAKWITKKGLVLEINAGIGRNLFNSEKNENVGLDIIGRGGIMLGYRF
jgi:hypothetical protein